MREDLKIAIVIIVILFGLNIYQYLQIEGQNEYLSKLAYSKDVHPINIEVQKCMKKENYTTGGMSYCVMKSDERRRGMYSEKFEKTKYLKNLK